MADLTARACAQCGEPVSKPKRGPVGKTCSNKCRMALSRKRRASVFPPEMAGERRWVRAVGKRPVMPDGRPASSTNPGTWSPLDDVRAGAGDGMGFMLGGGIGCYDLDNAVEDGALKPWARDVVRLIPEPVLYTELSVSGRGVHVFVAATESRGSRRPVGDGGVERYTRARFIRCGTPLELT